MSALSQVTGEIRSRATAERQARGLRALLGDRIRASRQTTGNGKYTDSPYVDATDEMLVAHFGGEMTLGFVCGDDKRKRARLIGFDYDGPRGPGRLDALRDVLTRRGLSEATICTGGSQPGNRKVLVFFAKDHPQRALTRLAHDLDAEARNDRRYGIIAPGDKIDLRPNNGHGGLLRIGGINRKAAKGATGLDDFFSLDGEPMWLDEVKPCRIASIEIAPEPIPVAPMQAWVEKYRVNGIPERWATKEISRFLMRAGLEFARCYGGGPVARAQYFRWVEDLRATSPALDERSSQTRDRRHPLDLQRATGSAGLPVRAWDWVEDLPRSLRSSFPRAGPSARRDAAALLYGVLLDLLRARGLSRIAFQVSYRELARFVGWSNPCTAYRIVEQLEADGLIVRHHRGIEGPGGPGSKKTYYGIVLPGETPEEILRRGRRYEAVAQRLERYPQKAHGAPRRARKASSSGVG
jgi:hypothetical protein